MLQLGDNLLEDPLHWLTMDECGLARLQAARPTMRCTKARCAGMSFTGTARTWPLASIAIASTPARVRRAVQKLAKPSIGAVLHLTRRCSCSTLLLSQRSRRWRV